MSATRYTIGKAIWIVADVQGLCGFFGVDLAGSETVLPELHARLAEKEMMWNVVRRRHGIREVTEADPRRMVAQDDWAIAKELSMHPDAVEEVAKRALSWWKRRPKGKRGDAETQRVNSGTQQELVGNAGEAVPGGAQGDGLSGRDRRDGQEEAAAEDGAQAPVDERLGRYGFFGEKDPAVVRHLVQRFDEHSDLLESAGDRGTMIKMLGDEVTLLFVVMPRISKIRGELCRAQASEAKSGASDVDANRMKEAQAMADDLQNAIEKSKKALGLGEGEGGAIDVSKRMRGNVSLLIEGHRSYYAKGDRRLVDGVHTFAELRLLLKVYGDRPAQLRGDLPLIAAQVRDRLWDDSCDPVGPTRDEQRRIRAAVVRITEAMEIEDHGAIEDLAGDEAEPAAQAPALRAGNGPAGLGGPDGRGNAVPAEPALRPREREQVFV